jgi:hypothetical protein
MRSANAVMVFSLLLAAISAAHADWQYTRWGMTPEEVLTASNGQLKRCDPVACAAHKNKYGLPKLFGTYQSGEFKFSAFAFASPAAATAPVGLFKRSLNAI